MPISSCDRENKLPTFKRGYLVYKEYFWRSDIDISIEKK
jgi:hypothetical protein